MRQFLAVLGSLKLALAGMLMLLSVILYDLKIASLPPIWMALCLALLCLNLLMVVVVRPQFRRQPALLMFHLCLAAVAGLAALQSLVVFDARIEQAENQPFDVENVEIITRGPWHADQLHEVRFRQGTVTVDYRPELRRGQTLSTIYQQLAGTQHSTIFGDTVSYQDRGYRFVTTPNKGYALTLVWRDDNGGQISGSIHMPSYPLQEWDQRQQWRTPAGETVALMLELPPVPTAVAWQLSSDNFDGRVLLVRADGSELELPRNKAVALVGGSLELTWVGLWIGYSIEYNPLLPWLFASAALGVAALGWHFWRNPPRFRSGGDLANAV